MSSKLSASLRSSIRVVGLLAGAVVLALTLGAAWLAYSSHQAQAQVEAFCSTVSIDQSTEGLAVRARASGLKVSEIPNPSDPSTLVMLVMQGVGFARHLCTIESREEKVTKVERSFID